MTSILLILFTTLISSLIFLSSPLAVGVTLLLISLIATILLAHQTSSLLAIILFLVYVGGVIIIFAYFLSCCPNTKNPHSGFNIKFIPLLVISTMPFLIPIDIYRTNFSHQLDQKILAPIESPQRLSIIILIVLLLLTIIIVVKIATIQAGPIRPFKNV